MLTVSSYCSPSLAVLTILLLFFYSRCSLLSSRLTAHMSHVILNEWLFHVILNEWLFHVILNEWLFPTTVDCLRLSWLCISNYCWPSSSTLELMSSSGIDRLQLVLTVSSLRWPFPAGVCGWPVRSDIAHSLLVLTETVLGTGVPLVQVDSTHSPHAPFNFVRVDLPRSPLSG